MKQKLTICAGLLILALADAAPAVAQPWPVYSGPMALPPYEVMAIVRSRGFRPLQGPERRGPVYWVRAIDPYGQPVRVVVNARMGRIVAVAPLGTRYAAPMPPYARPPAAIPSVPYGANPSLGSPDDFDDDMVGSIPPVGPDGRPLPQNPAAKPRSSTGTQPPLPRPRPKVAAADTAPADTSPVTVETSAPPAPAAKPNAVKPAAPAAVTAKPAASPTDGVAAKPAPIEE